MTLTSTHWGVYRTRTGADGVPVLAPFERDRRPSPIGLGMVEAVDRACAGAPAGDP